jgi:antitoxin (DNA-binding transcriptional repressor) of toxin-antitoxin stability system
MTTLPISLVGAELPALITQLRPGEEIVLVDGEKPVARVTPVGQTTGRQKRMLGSAKGILRIISEDDDHLADFAEYM